MSLLNKASRYLSDQTENGANENNRTKEHVWHQNEDYVVGATC